jgi:NADH-quinone oxidoreductase subunit J
VAITQVLVYVGAVMVLFLFGTMLTRAKIGAEADLNNKNWGIAVPVSLLMFGVITWVLIDGFGDERLPNPDEQTQVPIQVLSDDIFGPYLLPFWALSFVLLVAVIGAIVLARKD